MRKSSTFDMFSESFHFIAIRHDGRRSLVRKFHAEQEMVADAMALLPHPDYAYIVLCQREPKRVVAIGEVRMVNGQARRTELYPQRWGRQRKAKSGRGMVGLA